MPNRSVDFQFLAEPGDVNFGGKVHGGMVMKWIDQTGYACAVGWSGCYCVTVSVGTIRFHRPIMVGHLVHLNAKVVYTGNTSIHVFVTVESRDPTTDELIETNRCIITFVATDEHGKKVSVQKWSPESEEDKKLEHYAQKIQEMSMQAEAVLKG
jgi:acyl-CoA hydrolase